jgi:DNA-binding CsgD family transcriptional regulator
MDVRVWHDANAFPKYGAQDETGLLRCEWFRRVMEPENWRSCISVGFYEQGNVHSGFWLHRAIGQPCFSDDDVRRVEHYYPWIETALRRVRLLADHRARNLDIAAGLFDNPVATFLLDWDMRPEQANRAAVHACAAWRHGPEKARQLKLPHTLATRDVPAEIRSACASVREQWVESHQPHNGKPSPVFSLPVPPPRVFRLNLVHPLHPRLDASITLLRPNALRLARPSFLVRITDAGAMVENGAPPAGNGREQQWLARLTRSERELPPLLKNGCSDKEIAAALGKSVPTVKNQLRSIYEKLRVPNRARLIAMLR